jgi:hypothetical protein
MVKVSGTWSAATIVDPKNEVEDLFAVHLPEVTKQR